VFSMARTTMETKSDMTTDMNAPKKLLALMVTLMDMDIPSTAIWVFHGLITRIVTSSLQSIDIVKPEDLVGIASHTVTQGMASIELMLNPEITEKVLTDHPKKTPAR